MRILPFYFLKKFFKLKYLAHKYLLKTTKPIKSFYGVYLTPNFYDTTFMYYFKGTYGFFLNDFLTNISSETTFIDIGANQGLFSILAGKNKHVKQVISFEPTKKTAKLLRANIDCNNIQNCLVVEKGISEKSGFLNLNVAEGHSGKNTFRTDELEENISNEKVEIINHEDIELLVQENTNYVIKIDVEGHEEVVINELTKCSFIQNVSYIFCEIDTNWVDVERLMEKLASVGFSSFEKVGNGEVHYDMLISRN